ncbi:MAG: hypothetical protein ACLGH0_05065 [Thermoanaerobaculia bacterium]
MLRAALALPLLLCISCATALTGRMETITVDSDPAAANVALKCENGTTRDGVTPFETKIPRGAGDCDLTISKEGFAPQELTLEKRMNRAFWGNFATVPLALYGVVAVGGLLFSDPEPGSGTAALLVTAGAWLIDTKNQALWRREPSRIRVTLQRE